MFINKIIKLFQIGNVCVTGLRGSGKDMLFSNVIARRKKPYVSNIDYGGEYHPLDFDKIDCGKNTWRNFITGDVSPYDYPYPMGADVYLSDAGIYLPAQYCGEINKAYPYIATYQALSRQVSRNNFHVNAQNLNRVYDKVREQSDIYIRCNKCIVLFGKIVIQKITMYDKYESAVARVRPCRVRKPWFNADAKMQADIYLDNFFNQHGTVKSKWLLYWNKGKYDTYYFGNLLSTKSP